MNSTNRNCLWVLDRLDALLDGADGGLSTSEARLVETHVASCPACARELDLARRCRDELRSLPLFEAPPEIVAGAERAAGRGSRPGGVIPLSPRAGTRARWIPALAAALALAAAGLWWSDHRPSAPTVSDNPGPDEMRAAALDAAVALAYVGKYTQRTGDILVDETIGLRIVLPVHRALTASREAVIDDALAPGMRRALQESGLGATSEPHRRS